MIEMQPCAVSPETITILRRFEPDIADQLYFEPEEVHQLAVNRLVRFDYRHHFDHVEKRLNAV